MKNKILLTVTLSLACCYNSHADTQANRSEDADLSDLSIESLMDIEVTSASKHKQAFSEVPAAVFVLTTEDIRRSGATSIAEALRLVPGLHVARIDGNRWAISARGLNGLFANSLLVLIDGRSVYTPLFSGVYWDAQDTMLEDVERIEVIRGPGATMWGSNAVNGVINIITKHSKDTTGTLVSVGGGNDEHAVVAFRHGFKVGTDEHFRVYGKFADRGNSQGVDGQTSFDSWQNGQGGFRFDSSTSASALSLQGNIYTGRDGMMSNLPTIQVPFVETLQETTEYSGGNALARWSTVFDDQSSLALQFYYDRSNRDDLYLKSRYDTLDSDIQYQFALGNRNTLMIGGGFRYINEELDSKAARFEDDHESRDLLNLFAQDDLVLMKDRLKLTFGAKIEHNDYTGSEVQPRIALTYTPAKRHTLWASVARASRIPSRAENDIALTLSTFPGENGLPVQVDLSGNQDLKADQLIAYDLGYRAQLLDSLTIDTNAFYHDYSDIDGYTPGQPYFSADPSPHIVSPLSFDDIGSTQVYGCSLVTTWQALEDWQIQAWYTHWEINSFNTSSDQENPLNQFSLRSNLNIRKDVEFDAHLRFVDRIPAYDIDSYIELNTRLGWHLSDSIELSLSGINLLHAQHAEYAPNIVGLAPSEIGRAVFAGLRVKF